MSAIESNDLEHLISQVNTTVLPAEAYRQLTKAILAASNNNDLYNVASIQLLFTKILIQNGAYEEALIRNSKALKYFAAVDEEKQKAECWRQMALIYGFLGDKNRQQDYNRKSLSIFRELNEYFLVIKVLNNIGHTHFELEEYEAAETIFKSNLNEKGLTNDLYLVSLKNLGKVHFMSKKYSEAESIFKKVLQLADEFDLPIYTLASNFFLGQIYFLQNDPLKALPMLINATDLHESKGYFKKELFYMYEVLIEVLLELRDIDLMKIYYKKYKELNKYLEGQRKNYSQKSVQFQLEINEIERKGAFLAQENQKLQEANAIIERQKEVLTQKSIQLQRANEELSEFAYRVAHDLKQPILTVKNFIGLLGKEMKGELSDRSTKFMYFINNASKEMTNFVDDILRYAESDQQTHSYELVDCMSLIRQIESQLSLQLKKSNAQLVFDGLEPIYAHKSLMLQVFQNLISNAIKFRRTDVKSIVKIESRKLQDVIIYEISDNGIGIRDEDKDEVFRLFTRLNNKSEFAGSGIGLSTVVKILKRYNATIGLDSEYGKGTTFKITFPIEKAR